LRATGGEEMLGDRCLPELGLRAIPAMQWLRAGAEDSESFVGLWWSYCGARGGLCCSGAALPWLCRAVARWSKARRGVARLWAMKESEVRAQGCGAAFKEDG
jgi:hypothetical protein